MIHPSAIISPKAQIAENVKIGPFCVIGDDVKIGAGCTLEPHVVIYGPTEIGENNHFFSFGSIGADPQDKKFKSTDVTTLKIGSNNTFRENVTINRGTVQDIGTTIIGDNNWIMAGVHIAHDCVVGSNTIFANQVALAGHVIVDDWAILGGYTLVHQFLRIGAHSFCGMGSVINQNVPDFVVVSGNIASPHGMNFEGLKRRGFDKDQLSLIKKAYRVIYRSELKLCDAISELKQLNDDQQTLTSLINFLENAKHGIVR